MRIVIKIGSSSLTSRNGEISLNKIKKLVDEIVFLKDAGHEVVLVSSGAVAAGYRKLGCLKRPDTLPEKQAAASIGQGLLMESYSKLFMSNGYTASQILITRSDLLDEERYINILNTLNILLERDVIPIINENDTVTVEHLNFGDNDTLSAKIGGLIDADQLIILSDIEGLYNADPCKNQNAKLLEQVSKITPEIEEAARGASSSVGTGGMKSKIEAVKIALASGVSVFIGNAERKNIIKEAVCKKAKGTYFDVEEPSIHLNQKEKWIAFHSCPKGEIIVDQHTKQCIADEGQGLKSTGIIDVSGPFDKGSVVRINDAYGNNIGCGIVNLSSDELMRSLLQSSNQDKGDFYVMERSQIVCHVHVPITV